MSVKTKKWVLKSMFDGLPKREDFEIIEEELPLLKDGGRKFLYHYIIYMYYRVSC